MKIKKFFIIPILLLMVTGVYVLINLLPKNVEAASDSSSTSDLQLMARAINGEARGEPYEGQVAVGAVILNRVKSSQFPNTIAGKKLNQAKVQELSKEEHLILLCGHYEGVDQRVLDEIVDEEISIGDYVLTGGELPAMVLIDSVSRYVEGVLSTDSTKEESFSQGYLEYSQYTRPEEFHGKKVPEILASGNHQKIDEWRRKSSLINTFLKRPELLNEKDLKEAEKIISEEHEN